MTLSTTKFQEFTNNTSGRYILVPRNCTLVAVALHMSVISLGTDAAPYCIVSTRVIDTATEFNTLQADREGILGMLRASSQFTAGGTYSVAANIFIPLNLKVFASQRLALLASSSGTGGSSVECHCIAYFSW